MKEKHCKFEFCKVSVGEVENVLLLISNDKPPGIDNLDGKLLKMVADSKATPICHIFSSEPRGKSLSSGLEGSQSNSATQEW